MGGPAIISLHRPVERHECFACEKPASGSRAPLFDVFTSDATERMQAAMPDSDARQRWHPGHVTSMCPGQARCGLPSTQRFVDDTSRWFEPSNRACWRLRTHIEAFGG